MFVWSVDFFLVCVCVWKLKDKTKFTRLLHEIFEATRHFIDLTLTGETSGKNYSFMVVEYLFLRLFQVRGLWESLMGKSLENCSTAFSLNSETFHNLFRSILLIKPSSIWCDMVETPKWISYRKWIQSDSVYTHVFSKGKTPWGDSSTAWHQIYNIIKPLCRNY